MDASAHRAFALLKSLAYERVSCSEAEKTAANRLLEEARAAGCAGASGTVFRALRPRAARQARRHGTLL